MYSMNVTSKTDFLKNEIDKEMKKRNTVLDDEIRKRCVQKVKEDKLLLISVTRKVKKDFNEKSKTMKKMLKDDEKMEKLNRKNAEVAFKLQLKENEKEEKKMRKKAEIAFKLQLKKKEKEVKKNKKDVEIQLNNITIDDSIVSDYLKKIVIENNKNDKELFDDLEGKRNVRNKQNELKNMKETVFDKQVVNYLNTICTDSGECLVFGRENGIIKKIFSDFIDFRYLSKVLNTGSESANGFVLNLHYESMNYKANALLKSSQNKNSDNLYYEYLVGIMFINKMNQIFPCFTETYHLFEHRTELSKNRLLKNELEVSKYSKWLKANVCDASVIKDSFKCVDESCKNGVNFAILVQYISNPISLLSFVDKHRHDILFEDQMICILYQIYACLSYLKDHYTHYDLHTGNVLLYKLPEGKYVNIKYIDEHSGNIVTIKTNYIAKIIDYGRCYFGNLGNKGLPSSETIGATIFNSKVCSKLVPSKVGYNFFKKEATERKFFISSLMRNKSHDLRLAYIVSKRTIKMYKMFDNRIIYTSPFGTPEKESDESGKIHNVTDMYHFLESLCNDGIVSVKPQDVSIGTIVVNMTKKLCAKKMVFEPENSIKL